jgi:hypothetical protein
MWFTFHKPGFFVALIPPALYVFGLTKARPQKVWEVAVASALYVTVMVLIATRLHESKAKLEAMRKIELNTRKEKGY